MATPIIKAENLKKTFKGNVEAVKDVSFEVKEGEFFAFLGPNGAGKSTTVQMLTTLLTPTSGQITVAGYDTEKSPEKIRQNIGVALQETGVDPNLTGRELLILQSRLFGLTASQAKARAAELLELVDLTGDADRQCGNYSGGMRRRLDLALALVHSPRVLFLDEPTTGLDPMNRKAVWEEIRHLNKEIGTTIFLTTQYLEEADQLADRISIIDKGTIVATGTAEELKNSIGVDLVTLQFESREDALTAKRLFDQKADNIIDLKEQLQIYIEDGTAQLPEIIRQLDESHIPLIKLNVAPPTLDDVFLNVTGERLKKAQRGVEQA
ncbi:ATP-binding cassette domain-containing protein [Pseudalkalibacillus sp. SCS-8]|uniref:ATP-binding cassette domain-containing protein n=1 Tax=Pseudalkalibacillus nanhaiensis TaxID=3115291 RepID=UPI0032DB2384